MSILMCPICKLPLNRSNKSYKCENNHCYDIAKKGYVNLLMSQKSSKKRHGDDKTMLCARTEFLEKGYYNAILNEIISLSQRYFAGGTYLDLGCGECFYTERIKNSILPQNTIALDISKDALEVSKFPGITKIVASISKIPIMSDSVGIITNIFAPINADEAKRVLCKNGILIRAVPLERHLFSLKTAVYEKPYENATDETAIEGFDLIEVSEIKTKIFLEATCDIINLFMMTPYYYKTSAFDFEKLKKLECLETELEVNVLVYKA